MATNTTNYSLLKPTVGGDADDWGGYLNTNMDTIDGKLDDIEGKTGAGTLKYANAAKLATTSTGVSVTGDLAVSNDATIGNDLTVTNDATITNDLTVSNDLTVTGDITAGTITATTFSGLGTMSTQNANNVAITGGNIAVNKVDATTETASGYGVRVRRAPSSGNATLQFTDNTATSQLAKMTHDGANLYVSANTGSVIVDDNLNVTGGIEVNTAGGSGGVVLNVKSGGDLRLNNAANTTYCDLYSDQSNTLYVGASATGLIKASGLLGDWVWNGSVMVGQVGAKMWDTSYGISPSLGGTVAGSAFTGTAQVGTWQFLNADYNGTANLWYFWVQRIA